MTYSDAGRLPRKAEAVSKRKSVYSIFQNNTRITWRGAGPGRRAGSGPVFNPCCRFPDQIDPIFRFARTRPTLRIHKHALKFPLTMRVSRN